MNYKVVSKIDLGTVYAKRPDAVRIQGVDRVFNVGDMIAPTALRDTWIEWLMANGFIIQVYDTPLAKLTYGGTRRVKDNNSNHPIGPDDTKYYLGVWNHRVLAVNKDGERLEDGTLFTITENGAYRHPQINPRLDLSLDDHGRLILEG